MLCNLQLAFVIQQAVKYVSRIAHAADDFGVKRAVLVRNMRVNLNAWLLTVLQIDLTRITPMAAYPKVLPIRRGGCPIAPYAARGRFFWALTNSASAAEYVSSLMPGLNALK
jgi:hypothetical protein